MCNPPQVDYFLRKCRYCPDDLTEYLLTAFKDIEDEIDEEIIAFKQLMNTDKRCNLEDIRKPIREFVEYLVETTNVLATHSFVSFSQSLFIKILKEALQVGEFLVMCDFSENYSFIIQNEAQGYYFNKQQATIHPFVVYYKNNSKELQHWNLVIISECLKHDATAVYLFITKLIAK